MYYDYSAFSEITVQAAANSAEVAVPGVYTNTVMRTGGNQIHGSGYVDWEDKSFQGSNITTELQNQGFTQPDKFKRYNDTNFNAGGPFIKDKFWWFTSLKYQYSGLTTALNKSETDLSGGGPFETKLGGISTKLNYQLTSKDQLVWSHQRTTKDQPYRNGQGANAKNYIIDSTQNEEAVYFTNKVQFTSVLTNRMTLDAAWQWYNLYDPRYAHIKATPYNDTVTLIRRGAFGRETDTYRNRHQFYGNVAYSRQGHDFKFGFGEIYENNGGRDDCEFNDDAHSLVPCVSLTYSTGSPNTAIINDGPLVDNRNELLNTYAFAQDKWQITRKLTFNLGVRFDRYHSWYPEQKNEGTGPWASTTFFPTFQKTYPRRDMPILSSLVPRLSFVYDVFGNTKTAVKASYGRYGENTGTYASTLNPNAVHTRTYQFCSATRVTNCITGLPVSPAKIQPLLPSDTSANSNQTIDPNLKNAYTDEYTAGIEQEIIPDLGASVLFVRKIGHRDRVTLDRTYGFNEYLPVTAIDLGLDGVKGTADDQTITVYDRMVATRERDQYLTNFDYGSNYSTIEFTLTKRFTKKWQMQGGWDWTKLNAAPPVSTDPNSFAFQNGHSSQWTFKTLGSYELPRGIVFTGTFNSQRGAPYTRTQQFRGSNSTLLNPNGSVRTTDLAQGTGAITIVNNGYYLPTMNLTSMRVEKRFKITESQNLAAMFDLYNMFNWNTQAGRDSVTGTKVVNGQTIATFGLPNNILAPRIFKLGVRYSF